MSNTGQAKGVTIPSHRAGIGAGDSESVLIPKQYGRIAEWVNKHIRSRHAHGAGALFPPDYLVASEWATEVAAGRGTEGQTVYTYQGVAVVLYSTIQAAVDAWKTSAVKKSIFIADGTYTEDVVVQTANAGATVQPITIEGFGDTGVFIDGDITFDGLFATTGVGEWRAPSVIRNLRVSAAGASAGDLFFGQTSVSEANVITGLQFENCTFEGKIKPISEGTDHAVTLLRDGFTNCTFGGLDDNSRVFVIDDTHFTDVTFAGLFSMAEGVGTSTSKIGTSGTAYPATFKGVLFRGGAKIGDIWAGKWSLCTFDGVSGSDYALWISGGDYLYGPRIGDAIFDACTFDYVAGTDAEWAFIKLGSDQTIGSSDWENLVISNPIFRVPNDPTGTNPIHAVWWVGETTNSLPKIVFSGPALIEDTAGNRLEDVTTDPASTTIKGTFRDSVFGPCLPPNFNVELGTGSTNNIYIGTGTVSGDGAAGCADVPGDLAPNDAQYLTLALDGDLSAERRFVPGTGLTATDDGADGDYHLIHATDASAIPSAHHAKYLDSEAVAALVAYSGGDLTFYDTLYLGANDVRSGLLGIYGKGTGYAHGGLLKIYLATDHDTAFDNYDIFAYEDDLIIQHDSVDDLVIKADHSIQIPNGALTIDSTAKIGASGAPDASAVLELSSTTKGFLPPRLTTAQRDAIGSPATGLIVFNTTVGNPGFYAGAWKGLAVLDGLSGGQTLIGGPGAGDDLVLQSTSHATKGNIILPMTGAADYNLRSVYSGSSNPGRYCLNWEHVTEDATMHPDADVRQFLINAHSLYEIADRNGDVASAENGGPSITINAGEADLEAKYDDQMLDGRQWWGILITGGTGSGQMREITAVAGKVATVDHTWDTIPDATSTYAIHSMHRHLKFYAKGDGTWAGSQWSAIEIPFGQASGYRGVYLPNGFYMQSTVDAGVRMYAAQAAPWWQCYMEFPNYNAAYTNAQFRFGRGTNVTSLLFTWFKGDNTNTPIATMDCSNAKLTIDTIDELTANAGVTIEGSKLLDSFIELAEIAKPANPADGSGRLYMKNDDKVYFLSTGGVEYDLCAESGAVLADGTVPLTADWNVGAFKLTMDELVVTSAANDPLALLTSTRAGNEGAVLQLYQNSASPAASDTIGSIEFWGLDDDAPANKTFYGRFLCQSQDISDGSEDGIFKWYLTEAGAGVADPTAANYAMALGSTGLLYLDASTGGSQAHAEEFDALDDPLVLRQMYHPDRATREDYREELVSIGVMERVPEARSGYHLKLQPMLALLAGGIYQLAERVERLEAATCRN